MQTKKQQLELDMEQWTGLKLGMEYVKAVCCHPCLLNSYAEYIVQNAGVDESKDCWERAALVVRWLTICLPIQGIWVQSLLQEDPTCHGRSD